MKAVGNKKQCSACKEWKPLDGFYKDRHAANGLCYRCKLCRNESTRQWTKGNRQKVRIIQRRWQEKNPEKIARKTARSWGALLDHEVRKRVHHQWGVPWDQITDEMLDLKRKQIFLWRAEKKIRKRLNGHL